MDSRSVELLFPPSLIPSLQDLKGTQWQELVGRALQAEALGIDRLAFVLMMVHLAGCSSCQADSFRAMQGCSQCARQAIRHFRGKDDELIERFRAARLEIEKFRGKISPEIQN